MAQTPSVPDIECLTATNMPIEAAFDLIGGQSGQGS
jgi:hypothetical protein